MQSDGLQKTIRETQEQDAKQQQYGVSQTPFHTHNGADSNRVSFSNITDRVHIETVLLDGDRGATAGNYNAFFTAPFAMRLSAVNVVFATAGTDGSAVTLQVEKLTSGTASGSGTALLASALSLKATINVPQYGTLASLPRSTFVLKKGDRLGLKLSGTPTSVANLAVTCTLIY